MQYLAILILSLLALSFASAILYLPFWAIRNFIQKLMDEMGRLPLFFFHTKKNFLRVHIMVAAKLLMRNRQEFNSKRTYIRSYIYKNFKVKKNFGRTYQHYFNYPPENKYIIKWLRKYLKSEKERKDFLRFMLYISILDSNLTKKEKIFIHDFAVQLYIDEEWIEQQLDYYENQFEEQKKKQNNRTKEKVSTRVSKAEKYAKILGIDTNSEVHEIKKVYRSLVKKYHPDKVRKLSQAGQDNAKQKFLEIQEAYEYFAG